MIHIQHERMAFRYAVVFVTNEIKEIEKTLLQDHLLEVSERLLTKRLAELKSDLATLESYSMHE